MKVVTSAQMRELERRAADAGISEDILMEAAGLAVARRVGEILGDIRGRRALILVGPGNNGCDGMVAARHLAGWGGEVTLYMTSARRRQDKLEECKAQRIRVIEAESDPEHRQLADCASLTDIVVDAVLGIGNDRPLEGVMRSTFEKLRTLRQGTLPPNLIALDVPTGVNADTGAADNCCLKATITLALGAPKVGLFTFPGAACVGIVEALGIGLPDGIDDDITIDFIDSQMATRLLPERKMDGHKGTFGSVLLIAGSRRFIGAPVLAAEAAYRTGSGMVTLAAPESTYQLAAARLLEQTHLPQPETDDGYLALEAALPLAKALAQADAAVIGPGLGNVDSVRRLLGALLLGEPAITVPMVIDADALNGLAATYGWWERLAPGGVLTPHPGEMSRLLGKSLSEIQADRTNSASEAAVKWRQVVVLKGAHTIVASPDGHCAINPIANPILATAGTGDVLSGIIGSLLGQGLAPYDAAVAGVYVHAMAGQRIAIDQGNGGLLASDLLPIIPQVMRPLRSG
jgi:hydroxyethylthiazole kinase-like uncharacterized protein yjeF